MFCRTVRASPPATRFSLSTDTKYCLQEHILGSFWCLFCTGGYTTSRVMSFLNWTHLCVRQNTLYHACVEILTACCSRISMKGSQLVDLAAFTKVTNRPLPEQYPPRTNESTDTPIHRCQEDRLVVTAVITSDTSNCFKCLQGVIRRSHRKQSPLLDKDLRFCAKNIALPWICIVRHSIRVIRKFDSNGSNK